jgi:hypothetical protein
VIFHLSQVINLSYYIVSLFNEYNDKFGKLEKDCWMSMSNVEYIDIKLTILKVDLPMDAIGTTLGFIKFKYMSLLYNRNNPWIISLNVKFCQFQQPFIKNKQIDVSRYNYFLCITLLNK